MLQNGEKLPTLLICCYQPKRGLISLIEECVKLGFKNIVVVDDGSRDDLKWIFQKLVTDFGVTLLTNDFNYGKGHALKKGFKHILENTSDEFVVCADADGQHRPEDILKVALETNEPKTLVMGCRGVTKEFPIRNRFGNLFTRRMLSVVSGKYLMDTQTGLRGLHRDDLPRFLGVSQNRYDYEIKQLLIALKMKLAIKEVTIQTVYHQERDSHFRAIVDSSRILKALFGLG